MIVPLVALLFLGIADFGLAWNYKNDETSLANQALRYAEVNSCPQCGAGSIESFVKSTADSTELQTGSGGTFGIQSPGVTISFCRPPGSTGAVGDSLQANAVATYKWLPFLALGDATLKSTAIGRIEVNPNSPGPPKYTVTGPC